MLPTTKLFFTDKKIRRSVMKLRKVKRVIKRYITYGRHGLFNSRNIVGDKMETLYCNKGVIVDLCFGCDYFEVFGLNTKDFEKLLRYYNKLAEKELKKELKKSLML